MSIVSMFNWFFFCSSAFLTPSLSAFNMKQAPNLKPLFILRLIKRFTFFWNHFRKFPIDRIKFKFSKHWNPKRKWTSCEDHHLQNLSSGPKLISIIIDLPFSLIFCHHAISSPFTIWRFSFNCSIMLPSLRNKSMETLWLSSFKDLWECLKTCQIAFDWIVPSPCFIR